MTDRPIIFSGPMVRALLDGRKTQTRRVLKPQPQLNEAGLWRYPPDSACEGDPKRWVKRFGGFCQTDEAGVRCLLENPTKGRRLLPYAPRDRLYVREAHALVPSSAYRMSPGVPYAVNDEDGWQACVYREGWERSKPGTGWRSSIHMPRWASRISLTVTEVRVQRLQDISEADAVSEGIFHRPSDFYPQGVWTHGGDEGWHTPEAAYRHLWNSLHGPEAWDANPWVVGVSFTVDRRNINSLPTKP